MRRIAKTDANHAAIIAALRQVGASVVSLHAAGDGLPDLLVGWRGANYLLEVKSAAGRLTPAQARLHATWAGRIAVVRSVDEALRAIGVEETR